VNKALPGQAPSTAEVISALSRTGFILEHRVAHVLRAAGFNTDINHAYPDPESGASREVDVFAIQEHELKRAPANIILDIYMIIECKSGTNPFILVGEHGQDPIIWDDSIDVSFDPLLFDFSEKQHSSIRHELGLETFPGSYAREDFVGRQLLRMNRQGSTWKADNNSIYDSILYPLAKAWRHEVDYVRQDGAESNKPRTWEFPLITYIFPVIVTAGPIFAVDVTGNDLEVNRVEWAPLKRKFMSESLRGEMRADVVSFEHLSQYVDSRILSIVESAKDAISANIHLYDPEWLIANLGKPKKKKVFDAWLNHFRSEGSWAGIDQRSPAIWTSRQSGSPAAE
jgi:hypothetical protein